MTSLLRPFVVIMLGLAACADNADGGTCPDHPAVDACCCFEAETNDGHRSVANVCGGSELCPQVALECEGAALGGPCTAVDSEANLDCVLQALAGDKPGSVDVTYTPAMSDGYPNRSLRYFVVGDGTVFLQDITRRGDTSEHAAIGRRMVQPASFFTDCLAGTVQDRAGCVLQAALAEASEVCVEAFVSQDVT
jgi:hypothetical protein